MSNFTSTDRQVVTALFDTQTEAQRAVDRLAAEGIPRSDVRLIEGDASSADRTAETGVSGRHKGFWESLGDLFMPDEDRYSYAEGLSRGGFLVSVTASATNRDRVLDILDDEGTVNMDERETSWRSEGWSGYEAGSSTYGRSGATGYDSTATDRSTAREAFGTSTGTTAAAAGLGSGVTGSGTVSGEYAGGTSRMATGFSGRDLDRDGTIDVTEEQLRVGKRDVSHGRVRVRSYVVSEPVTEQVSLRQEHVEVERRPVDRAVTGTEAFQDRTLELEEHAEEAVVSKNARVKEEISLNRRADERTETVSDTVRRTEVEIEDERSGLTGTRETGLTGTTGRTDRDRF